MASGRRDYYEKGEVLDVDEDFTHEFKGHTSIAYEEVYNMTTKQPVSKYV